MNDPRVLVIGFGNPGRGDDGLGPALVQDLERRGVPGIELETDYQLAPEHAAAMKDCAAVVFVDASVYGDAPFCFEPVTPGHDVTFTTHSLTPSQVLGLAETLGERRIPGYVLAVRGVSFEPFTETLSAHAQENLRQAMGFLVGLLQCCPARNLHDAAMRVREQNCEGAR